MVPERQEDTRARTVELTDARAMRAYAHPLRLALLGLLRTRGALTATQAAARLGESSGSCSFHLRQLAKYGLVEEAGGGRGRERPWRATADFTIWGTHPDPERRAAERHLDAVVARHYLARIDGWLERRHADPPEWQAAAGYGDVSLAVTAGELRALRDDLRALVAPYAARVTGAEAAPPDARLVALIQFAFPEPDGP